MAKQTFTTGQVLTAAQLTSLQQTAMGGGSATAKTGSYTLVAADAGTTVIMNSASATTITVNTGLFAAGDTVFIVNQGAGVCTITAGTATVDTASSLALSQYETGELYFLSTSAAIFSEYTQASAATGGMTLLSTTTLSGATTTISSISPTGYNYLYLEINGITCSANNDPYFQINGVTTTTYQTFTDGVHGSSTSAEGRGNRAGVVLIVTGIIAMKSTGANNIYGITITNPNSSINKNIFLTGSYEGDAGGFCTYIANINAIDVTSAISSMTFKTSAGTFSGGTVKIYGVK